MDKKEKLRTKDKPSTQQDNKSEKKAFFQKAKSLFSKKPIKNQNQSNDELEKKAQDNNLSLETNLEDENFSNDQFHSKIEAISSNGSSSELIASIRDMNDPLKELDKPWYGEKELTEKINDNKTTLASLNNEYIKSKKDSLDNKTFFNKIVLFIKANFATIKFSLILIFIFLLIYMFVMLMIPQLSAHSQTSFTSLTSFYSGKFSLDFTKYYLSLTPAGIIFIVFLILALGCSIITFLFNKDKIISKYKVHSKQERKMYLFKLLTLSIGLGVIFFIFLIFVLIPPNMQAMKNYYLDQAIIDQALSSKDLTVVQNAISQLNPNNFPTPTPDLNTSSIGTLTNYLLSYQLKSSFPFTFYQSFAAGVVSLSSGIYAIIVLFSVFFISFITLEFVINFIFNKKINFNKFFSKDKFLALKAKIKENQIQKKQISFAKKQLAQRETELLKSLNDVNLDKIDEEKKLGLISQEELESKISKNNEIKKQLDELLKQKTEIEKQRISLSKIKAAINKAQTNKDMKTGKEKQKITIPDKELDEIFKNLEID